MRTSPWTAVAALGAAAFALSRLAGQPSRSLADQVVLLTGGSRGLGLQLARELTRQGCKLILVARDNNELFMAQAELREKGGHVDVIACDLSQPDQLAAMVAVARTFHQRIDIVINDAGRIDVGPVDSMREDDFHASMDLMLWAPVRIVLALLPDLLKAGDADIVNIASVGGRVAVPHLLPYSTAKFALVGFSEGLDAEVRSRGVHVLTVTPGLLRTGGHKKAHFGGDQNAEYQWFALGASLPGASMQVGRAARQIVAALKARRRTLTLTWTAQVAARLHGAFPGAATTLMGVMNEFLPSPSGNSSKIAGEALEQQQSMLFRAITAAGAAAAESQNENLQPGWQSRRL